MSAKTVEGAFSDERKKAGFGNFALPNREEARKQAWNLWYWAERTAREDKSHPGIVLRISANGYFSSPSSEAAKLGNSFGGWALDPGRWYAEGLKLLKAKRRELAAREKPVYLSESEVQQNILECNRIIQMLAKGMRGP